MKLRRPSHLAALLPVATVALLLLVPVPSAAKDTWTRIQSKNFTLVGNASERDLRKIAIHLEQFREAISRFLPRAEINSSVPTTVVVFKSDSSYQPFKPKYRGKTRSNVAGYFLPGADGNYITLNSEARLENPFQLIFHEYFHFLVGRNLIHAPVWLNEGLADFYSTLETLDKDQKVMIGKPISVYLRVLNSNPPLPIKTLLTVEHSSSHYNDSSKTGMFYSESWALVHYLMLGNKGARHSQFMQFIGQLHSGIPLEENFRQSFQADYKKIEGELANYTRRSAYPALEYTLTKQFDSDQEVESRPLSEAEVQYYLGDLLLHANRLDEAEGYLQRSLELGANAAQVQISLAVLRIRQQRFAEARKLLQSAIAADPRNYLGQFYYAEDLSQSGKYEEAVKYYQQAITLKPDLGSLHAGLGFTYAALGQKKNAVEEFRQALQLDPTSQDYYHGRSFTYLGQGRGPLATTAALLALNLQGWRDETSMYMALTAHFGYREAHNDAEANGILKKASAMVDTTQWPYPVIRYLQHEITAQELLSQATDNDKQTEAHAYLGLDLSLTGKRDEALAHLRWVKENGNKQFYEYPLALAELSRLEGNSGRATQ